MNLHKKNTLKTGSTFSPCTLAPFLFLFSYALSPFLILPSYVLLPSFSYTLPPFFLLSSDTLSPFFLLFYAFPPIFLHLPFFLRTSSFVPPFFRFLSAFYLLSHFLPTLLLLQRRSDGSGWNGGAEVECGQGGRGDHRASINHENGPERR